MGVVHQVVSTILIANVVSCYDEVKFEVDTSLAGKVCPAGQRVFEGTVASFLSCAVASEEAGSAGIAYIKGTLMCYGCDVMSMYQTGAFQTLPGAVFYRRDRFKGLDYWIQCRLNSQNVWRYDDGSLVPMTSTFWHPGEPGDNDTKCCYMWGRFNYKWDNIVCAFQKAYICELT